MPVRTQFINPSWPRPQTLMTAALKVLTQKVACSRVVNLIHSYHIVSDSRHRSQRKTSKEFMLHEIFLCDRRHCVMLTWTKSYEVPTIPQISVLNLLICSAYKGMTKFSVWQPDFLCMIAEQHQQTNSHKRSWLSPTMIRWPAPVALLKPYSTIPFCASPNERMPLWQRDSLHYKTALCVCVCVCVCVWQSHKYIHMCAHTNTHTHCQTRTNEHTHAQWQVYTTAHIQTYWHILTHVGASTYTYIQKEWEDQLLWSYCPKSYSANPYCASPN